jgi:Leucine-rich repeat (LRR) protein
MTDLGTASIRYLDGVTTSSRTGSREKLLAAVWPLARLAAEAIALPSDLRRIERLDLTGEYFPTQVVDAAAFRSIAALPYLTEIALHGTALTPGSLLRVTSGMSRLTSLDIRGLDVRDDDVRLLATIRPGLRELCIGWARAREKRHVFEPSRLTTEVWRQLEHFKSLRRLSVLGLPLGDAVIDLAPHVLSDLDDLDLGDTQCGDETAKRLLVCNKVRRLAFDGTGIGDRGLEHLAGISSLEELDVSRTAIGAGGLQRMAERARLTRLGLSRVRVGDEGVAHVRSIGTLRELDLSGTAAGGATLAAISRLSQLEHLNLDGVRLPDGDLSFLAACPLASLRLGGDAIDAAAIETLAKIETLSRLALFVGSDWSGLDRLDAAVDLTAAPASRVRLPRRLWRLNLAGPLTAALRDALASTAELERLQIPSGADLLSAAGSSAFPSLQYLQAEDSGLNDQAFQRIGELPQIAELYLSDNRNLLSIGNLKAPLLNTLELRNVPIDDTAVEALARLPRLHCLDIPFTRMTVGGIAALIAAAPNLHSLALDGSQIVPATATALSRSETLLELYLYGNAVTDSTIAQLAPITGLREINLFETGVTDAVVDHLAALPGLRTLRGVLLSPPAIQRLRALRPDILVNGRRSPSTGSQADASLGAGRHSTMFDATSPRGRAPASRAGVN